MKFKNQRTAVIIFCALGNCVQSTSAHCVEMQFHCNIWLLLFLCILTSNASIHRLTWISVMQLQELRHKEASVSLVFSVLIFNKQLLLQSICSNHHSFALVFTTPKRENLLLAESVNTSLLLPQDIQLFCIVDQPVHGHLCVYLKVGGSKCASWRGISHTLFNDRKIETTTRYFDHILATFAVFLFWN